MGDLFCLKQDERMAACFIFLEFDHVSDHVVAKNRIRSLGLWLETVVFLANRV
jgi:hypothetical protein